jgi:predicted alpha/beta-hydrolase family hydrolase
MMTRVATPEERLSIEDGRVNVSGMYARPADPLVTLVVAHGAGAGMDHPFMVGFTRALNELGAATLRFNFPYIENGRRAPDPAPYLQETWRAAFDTASGRADGEPVWAGGKSLGGRIASMAVADAAMPAAGLVFVSYPLHPPGKPERIRDEHLYRIGVPMIFVEGTRDPFATPELLAGVLAKLGDRAELISIEGGDHSLNVRGTKRDARAVASGLAGPVVDSIRKRTG